MIFGHCFAGDRNEKLKWIQRDLYLEIGVFFLINSKDRYYTALRVVAVDTELRRQVATVKRWNRRVLEVAYDKSATYYRFTHDQSGQMPLPFDGRSYEEYLIGSWCNFFHEEVKRLVEMDEVSRTILTAIAYQDSPAGFQAEVRLMEILADEYSIVVSRR